MVRNVDDDSPDPLPHPEHPLFPVEEGQKIPDISYIQIYRKEGGSMVCGPTFPASEIQTTDHISERYGGGLYEIVGRRANVNFLGMPGAVCRRRLLTLPGRPKLFTNEPTMQEKIAAGLTPDPTEAKPVEPKSPLGESNLLIAIMQMQMQASQASREQSDKFMMLMMQMMSEGKKEAAASSQQMMQMFTQMTTSQQTSMMQMLPLLIGQRGGGPEEFTKYVELMKALGLGAKAPEEKKDDESVGDILSNVADIVAGAPAALNALKEATSNAPGMNNLPGIAPENILPGSAASVLAGNR